MYTLRRSKVLGDGAPKCRPTWGSVKFFENPPSGLLQNLKVSSCRYLLEVCPPYIRRVGRQPESHCRALESGSLRIGVYKKLGGKVERARDQLFTYSRVRRGGVGVVVVVLRLR